MVTMLIILPMESFFTYVLLLYTIVKLSKNKAMKPSGIDKIHFLQEICTQLFKQENSIFGF